MFLSEKVVLEMMRQNKSFRMKMYGSEIFDTYQSVYRSNYKSDRHLFNDLMKYGTADGLSYFLKNRKLPMSKDEMLVEACKIGNLEIVDYLLSIGLDPYGVNNQPFTNAVIYRNFDVAQLLLSTGKINPNEPNSNPLIETIGQGDVESINFLISVGVKITDNALEIAVDFGDVQTVETLISAGANPAGNENGPLITAIRNQDIEMVELLTSYDIISNGSNYLLYEAVWSEDEEIVRHLLSLGISPRVSSNMPLIIAARSGNLGIVQDLVEYGADPTDQLAISRAMDSGNQDIVNYLNSFS